MKNYILIAVLFCFAFNSFSQSDELYIYYKKENKDTHYMFDSSKTICDTDLTYHTYYISIDSKDARFKLDLYKLGTYEKPKPYTKTTNAEYKDISFFKKNTPLENHLLFSLPRKIYIIFKDKENKLFSIKVQYTGTVKNVIATDLH